MHCVDPSHALPFRFTILRRGTHIGVCDVCLCFAGMCFRASLNDIPQTLLANFADLLVCYFVAPVGAGSVNLHEGGICAMTLRDNDRSESVRIGHNKKRKDEEPTDEDKARAAREFEYLETLTQLVGDMKMDECLCEPRTTDA
jgi:hypothetical protein